MNTIITSEGLLNIKLEEIQKEHGLPFKSKKPNPFVNVIEKEMKQQNPTIAMLIAMQSNIYERYVYPENQRNPEEGWTDKDREEYIITVIENTHKNTPCILNVVKKNKTEAARKRLIDGGHRIVAICAFTKNILKVNGRYYNQYSEEEQREFESREIIINEYKDLTESEEQSMMAIVNRHLNMSRVSIATRTRRLIHGSSRPIKSSIIMTSLNTWRPFMERIRERLTFIT